MMPLPTFPKSWRQAARMRCLPQSELPSRSAMAVPLDLFWTRTSNREIDGAQFAAGFERSNLICQTRSHPRDLSTDVAEFGARVGVWLMPDNQRTGALEHFLQDLVDDNDPLYPLAETSTAEAKGSGATFPEVDRRKAVLHTWLAWQEEPRTCPTARRSKARYFRNDSPAALAFVEWYRRVFP